MTTTISDPLAISGRRYASSFDAVQLVCYLVEMKARVEREIGKRGKVVPVPARIHSLSVNMKNMLERYRRRQFWHWEAEEGFVREFGEWLIATYANVCSTQARPWEHKGVPFDPASHLRR